MNYKDIPSFTPDGNYRVDVPWDYLKESMLRYQETASDGTGALDLNPDFQRGHVWDRDKQIAFIEFMLRGGKSARTIYLNHPNWMKDFKGDFVLVDGKQRLTAAIGFMDNQIPVFGGHFFKDIEGRLSSSVSFSICINNLQTRAEVLQWYLDLNTGGVVHTTDEIEKVKNFLKDEKQKISKLDT
jgi:hypothetical protein